MIPIKINRNDNPSIPKPSQGFHYVDQGNYLTLPILPRGKAMTLTFIRSFHRQQMFDGNIINRFFSTLNCVIRNNPILYRLRCELNPDLLLFQLIMTQYFLLQT